LNHIQCVRITTLIIFSALLLACEGSQQSSSSSVPPLPPSSKESDHSTTSVIDIEKGQTNKVNKLGSSQNTKQLITDLGFAGTQEPDTLALKRTNYCLTTSKLKKTSEERDLTKECEKISNRLASVTMKSCLDAKLTTTGCQSVLSFPILVRNFPPVKNRSPQWRILVIGGTHADELTSVSTVFKWIEILNKHHSGLFHWHIAPLMNPDGLLKKQATRTNHNGIDLNRNLPSNDWHETALSYWKSKSGKNPRRFPGNKPSSEPETQWLVDEINTFKPDAIISVHAPYGVVDFDSLLLKTAPKSLGKLHLNLLGTYPGSLGNYAGINRNIPVITVELPHAWEMPSESEITRIWEDIVAWLKANIDNSLISTETKASAEETN